jgi:hypothetical protein
LFLFQKRRHGFFYLPKNLIFSQMAKEIPTVVEIVCLLLCLKEPATAPYPDEQNTHTHARTNVPAHLISKQSISQVSPVH